MLVIGCGVSLVLAFTRNEGVSAFIDMLTSPFFWVLAIGFILLRGIAGWFTFSEGGSADERNWLNIDFGSSDDDDRAAG